MRTFRKLGKVNRSAGMLSDHLTSQGVHEYPNAVRFSQIVDGANFETMQMPSPYQQRRMCSRRRRRR